MFGQIKRNNKIVFELLLLFLTLLPPVGFASEFSPRIAPADVDENLKLLETQESTKAPEENIPLAQQATEETKEVAEESEGEFPIHFSAFVHNLGTKNTGEVRAGPGLRISNLTGHKDPLTASFEIGDQTHQVSADYHIPVLKTKSVLGIQFARLQVDAGGPFEPLALDAAATFYTAYAIQPLFKTKHFRGSVDAAFNWKRLRTDSTTGSRGKDDLRVFKAGFSIKGADRLGATSTAHHLHLGFDRFLGASRKEDPHLFVPGSGGQFYIYRGSIDRTLKLPLSLSLYLRGFVQLTPDGLSILEKMRLGGQHSVRGFLEADYLPDYGAHGSIEMRAPSYFIPEDLKLPGSKIPLRDQIQGVAFVDFGGGGSHKPVPGTRDDRYLAGMGGGLRIALKKNTYARFEWATPVRGRKRDGSDSAFHFGIYIELL